jgi:SAM-dependent methyltransferase
MSLTPLTYRTQRLQHWDGVARGSHTWRRAAGYYHTRLHRIYRQVIAPHLRVLEIGCGRGDLLAALAPSFGVGIDLSIEMLKRARDRHPALHFICADAHFPPLETTFDVIVLADLVNDVWDVQTLFEKLRPMCTPRTRIIMNFFSRLWEKPLNLARRLKLAEPMLEQNWLTVGDVENLLKLSGLERIRQWEEILWPIRTPVIDTLMNRVLVKLTPIKYAALTNMLVARPEEPSARNAPAGLADANENAPPKVSVIVAARNEAGNIPQIFARLPQMGAGTELIFVEGHSKDDTYAAIEREMAATRRPDTKLFRQTGVGKGDAVRLGFKEASGDILMILDADLTVAPEDLPRFYEAVRSRRGEFINGVRLVYPMEQGSMRFLNLLGNKFFGVAFSWVLGQSIKDTLCGTKVLRREDYELIAENRAYFGEFDPFGDFDLLFGAARLNLKLIDLPVRYRERKYGTTNINRFAHGMLLFRMLGIAARRIKFI